MHEGAQAPLVVEPRLIVGDMLGAESVAHGLAPDLWAPLGDRADETVPTRASTEQRARTTAATLGVAAQNDTSGAWNAPLATLAPTYEHRRSMSATDRLRSS